MSCVAGAAWGSKKGDFAVARYVPNGRLDSSFGENGAATTDLKNSSDDKATSVDILQDQKILVGGVSNGYFAMVRYYQSE